VRYILHEDARTDLVEAASFYREQAGVRLSQAFFDEFESAAKNLIQHPRLGGIWRNGRRRFLMSRFPYSLIYDVTDEEIRIYAVAHHSRRPAYWGKRRWNEP